MNQDNIINQASQIRSELVHCTENPIDISLNPNIIKPYIGSDDIRLIIIGQDPTVKNINSRKKIETTLNLDKNNALTLCPIIILGEPLLKLLTNKDEKVRNYWDYHRNTGTTRYGFLYSIDTLNCLGRNFFPFPHQPSIRKKFYNDTFYSYIEYVKKVIDVHSSDKRPLIDNTTRNLAK